MNNAELRARLDRLERSTNRLRALVAGLTVVIIGLALVVMLQPVTAEAQGRVVAARGFQLVNDDGNLVGEWTLNDRGAPYLSMWLGGSQVSLAVNAPASGENTPKTYFVMRGGDDGMVQISTPGTSSTWPSVIIYTRRSPDGTFWPIWSAPPGSAPGT